MKELLITKVKKLYAEYYSLIFMPDNGKPFFEFKLRKLFLYIFLFVLVSASTYSIIMTNFLSSTYSYLSKKEVYAVKLADTTHVQKNQIEDLEKEFSRINERINYLSELDNNIRNIVGLDNQSVSVAQISRSSKRRETIEEQNPLDLNEQALTQKAENINSQLDSKIEEMNTLINEVEERLRYLKSYPDTWPTYGRITSPYGWRTHPISKRKEFHTGIDIANSYGTSIIASGDGKVVFAGYKNGYGKTIIINHGYGYKTLYAHNSKLMVETGDYVKKGQTIAKMGRTGTTTGTHCHFEILLNGSTINPYKTLE